MKNPILFAVLLSTACEPVGPPTPAVDADWFAGAPEGVPTAIAEYSDPGNGLHGAASLPDGRFVFTNDRLLHAWGESGAEILGSWPDEWVPQVLETPLVIDDVIVIQDPITLAGVDVGGEVLWVEALDDTAVAIGGLVGACVTTEGGCVYTLLDPQSGSHVWTDTVVHPTFGSVEIVGDANENGFCLVGLGARVFDPDGVLRVETSLGSMEQMLEDGGAHGCTATPWGGIVSYSDFVGETHRVVGFGLDGEELWSVDLQGGGASAQVFGYLDGVLIRTDEGVRRLGPDGTEVWGPDTRPMSRIFDVAANGDMLVSVDPTGYMLHAVHEDGTPFMVLSLGSPPADIYIRHASLDGDRVLTTSARLGILDQDRWAQILVWG